MNIQNFVKYFTKWTAKTSVNYLDEFGGQIVGEASKEVLGYLSKGMTSNGQDGEVIPTTRSGGILFTLPTTILKLGDILDDKFQVIDYDIHVSHIEYKVKFIEKWNKGV